MTQKILYLASKSPRRLQILKGICSELGIVIRKFNEKNLNGMKEIEEIKNNSSLIKHKLSQKLKSSIRKVPELNFYLDDSLDYIEGIDKALKKPFNPIKGGF